MAERVLAIDYGERRVGLAISDPEKSFVSGLPTLDRRALKEGGLTAAIATLVAEREVERILVGMPYSLDGSIGPATELVVALAYVHRDSAEAGRRLTLGSGQEVMCYPRVFHVDADSRVRHQEL